MARVFRPGMTHLAARASHNAFADSGGQPVIRHQLSYSPYSSPASSPVSLPGSLLVASRRKSSKWLKAGLPFPAILNHPLGLQMFRADQHLTVLIRNYPEAPQLSRWPAGDAGK